MLTAPHFHSVQVDHLFIMCAAGAPEAAAFTRLGFREGAPNTHPGQGTSCRRFFFDNAYLELLWVDDPIAAQTSLVLPTQLWKRWSLRNRGVCPFGVVLRGDDDVETSRAPFRTWSYAPPYLPAGLAIDVASGVPLTEPAIFYLGFRRGRLGTAPVAHSLPARRLTGVAISMPRSGLRSEALQAICDAGLLSFEESSGYALQLVFDRGITGHAIHLQPDVPVMLRW